MLADQIHHLQDLQDLQDLQYKLTHVATESAGHIGRDSKLLATLIKACSLKDSQKPC